MNKEKRENNSQSKKDKLINYSVSAGIYLLFSLLFMLALGAFSKENASEAMKAIIDAFTVPAIFYLVIGVISLLSSRGAYDGLKYSFTKFGIHNLIPVVGALQKKETLYEYKERKDNEGRKWLPEVFFTGIAGLVISLILLVFYFKI